MTSWLTQRGSSPIVNPIIPGMGWVGLISSSIFFFLDSEFTHGKIFRPLPCGPSILVNMDHNYTIRPHPCGPFILVCMDHLWFLPLMLWTFYSGKVGLYSYLYSPPWYAHLTLDILLTYIYIWLSTWKIHREDKSVTPPQSATLTQIKVYRCLARSV